MRRLDFGIKTAVASIVTFCCFSGVSQAEESESDRFAQCFSRLTVNSYVQFEEELLSEEQVQDAFFALSRYLMHLTYAKMTSRDPFDSEEATKNINKDMISEFLLHDRKMLDASDRDEIVRCNVVVLDNLAQDHEEIFEVIPKDKFFSLIEEYAKDMYKEIAEMRDD